MIETAPRRQKFHLIANVPFADRHCRVPLLLEQAGDGVFLGAQSDLLRREQDLRQRNTLGVASCQKLRSRWGADRRRVKPVSFIPSDAMRSMFGVRFLHWD